MPNNTLLRFRSSLLLVSLLSLFSACLNADTGSKSSVVFLSPTHQASPFFKQTIAIMHAAADSLGLDLEVIHGEDLVVVPARSRAVLKRKKLPDYIMMSSLRGIAEDLIKEADQLGISTLVFNTGLTDEAFNQFRYKTPLNHWIGQVLPNDKQAGRLVAENLVDAARTAKKHDSQGKIQLIGINGSMRSRASEQREIGLREYAEQQPDLNIQQVIYTDWNQEEARSKTNILLKRFEQTSVIWTAADALALGSAQAIAASDRVPGKHVLTAGIDWLPSILTGVKDGRIAGSVGGHSFDGAWALVVIYDHMHGLAQEFVNEKTQFHWVGQDSIDSIRHLMNPEVWEKVNFKQFSKKHNGGKAYQFGFERILENSAPSSE